MLIVAVTAAGEMTAKAQYGQSTRSCSACTIASSPAKVMTTPNATQNRIFLSGLM